MKNPPRVSIVVVNWNGKELLKNCLSSLDGTDYEDFDVIVVDNGSTDGSVEMVREEFSFVGLVLNTRNLGFAKANNQGMKRALMNGADYVFLLNNDTEIIHKNWLKNLIEVAESSSKIGIVGCKLLLPNGNIQHAGGYVDYKGDHHYLVGDKIGKVDYVTGAAFLVKREVVNKIGLFDEQFSPAFSEEVDYCMRARKAGYWVVYSPRTVIIHRMGATAKKHSWLAPIIYRNRVRCQLLNYPLSWLIRVVVFNFISAVFERKNEGKRLGITNFKLKKGWVTGVKAIVNAYLTFIADFPEVLYKRRHRTAKIWS